MSRKAKSSLSAGIRELVMIWISQDELIFDSFDQIPCLACGSEAPKLVEGNQSVRCLYCGAGEEEDRLCFYCENCVEYPYNLCLAHAHELESLGLCRDFVPGPRFMKEWQIDLGRRRKAAEELYRQLSFQDCGDCCYYNESEIHFHDRYPPSALGNSLPWKPPKLENYTVSDYRCHCQLGQIAKRRIGCYRFEAKDQKTFEYIHWKRTRFESYLEDLRIRERTYRGASLDQMRKLVVRRFDDKKYDIRKYVHWERLPEPQRTLFAKNASAIFHDIRRKNKL